jgi:AGCS family alanine or glycine:cation symporter
MIENILANIVVYHSRLNALVWGPPLIIALIGTGIFLTVWTSGVQFHRFGTAMGEVLGKLRSKGTGKGTVTPFQAVATALASTVGVGNIAGVATAIHIGGPGALFWLLVSGLLGMCTKFCEIVAAIHYREQDHKGVMRGGAMYILRKGLGLPWLATLFALFTSLAAFGIGNMVQANSVTAALDATFGIDPRLSAVVLMALVAAVVLGGIRRVAEVAEYLVPFMCIAYVGGGLVVLIRFAGEIPQAIGLVLESAFNGHAAVGGFAGATVAQALRFGIARGLFSNEAGLGSAPIVHSAATTDHPVRQAMYGIFEVFVDTVIVCLMTGMVILVTGVWDQGLTGAELSGKGFEVGLPGVWGGAVVTVGLLTFAFSTLIGWSFYGETAAVYLLGERVILPYRLIWVGMVWFGATGSLRLVWDIADTLNGLMALPNLVAVLGSAALIRRLVREFFEKNA